MLGRAVQARGLRVRQREARDQQAFVAAARAATVAGAGGLLAGATGDNRPSARGRAASTATQPRRVSPDSLGVPRGQAQPYLAACIDLRPEHARSAIMLAELNAYGASG
ncbi:MAG TPA: hypothetical protein VF331_24395 [Polyangiales bacterium]